MAKGRRGWRDFSPHDYGTTVTAIISVSLTSERMIECLRLLLGQIAESMGKTLD